MAFCLNTAYSRSTCHTKLLRDLLEYTNMHVTEKQKQKSRNRKKTERIVRTEQKSAMRCHACGVSSTPLGPISSSASCFISGVICSGTIRAVSRSSCSRQLGCHCATWATITDASLQYTTREAVSANSTQAAKQPKRERLIGLSLNTI